MRKFSLYMISIFKTSGPVWKSAPLYGIPVIAILAIGLPGAPSFAVERVSKEFIDSSETGVSNFDELRGRSAEDGDRGLGEERSAKYAALIRAKSLSSLRSVVHNDQKLVVQRVKCRTELEMRRVPASCFWVLERESALHLLPMIAEMRDSAWLKKLCMSRVETVSSISELDSALRAERIPFECQTAMRSRVGDIRYKLESIAPQKLFEARFSSDRANHDD